MEYSFQSFNSMTSIEIIALFKGYVQGVTIFQSLNSYDVKYIISKSRKICSRSLVKS